VDEKILNKKAGIGPVVFLSAFSLFFLVGITLIFSSMFASVKASFAVTIILLFWILLSAVNLALNFISIMIKKNLFFPLSINNLLNRFLLFFAGIIGIFFLITRDRLEASFIEFNNRLIKLKKKHLKGEEILILLPRCIQNNECKNNVVGDINNCLSCGKCDILSIKTAIKDKGIKAVLVTGGTQARELVKTRRPKAIIAVACERELTSGILDTSTIQVIGIINIRMNGPCFNTRMDVNALNSTLAEILK